jgi:hypothetical protein
MSGESNPTSRDARLQSLIADYIKQVEAGETPNREELLARHPDLADSLAGFFREHDRMHDQATKLLDPDPAQAAICPELDLRGVAFLQASAVQREEKVVCRRRPEGG